ncbi:MAG: TonB family protein [Bacteroidia bacterium]
MSMLRKFILIINFLFLAGYCYAQNTIKVRKNDSTLIQRFFPGGEMVFMNLLRRNIHYPALESDRGSQGIVMLSFMVTEQGTVSGIKVDQRVDGSSAFEKEAIRCLLLIPWGQALSKGMPANVKQSIIVNFISKQ